MNDEIIKIQQGQYLDQQGQWQPAKAIYIQQGHILSLGEERTELQADHIIDARDCLILPGLIDLSVSLREPGNRDKGTIASETAAAAAGGVTLACCPPDTEPANDSHAVSKLIGELAHASGKCRIRPLGAMTKGLEGEHLAEYASLKRAGCVAVSNAYRPITKLSVAKRCLEYAKTQEMTVFVNPIEPSLYRGSMHEGTISTTIGLQGISSLAETIAVGQYLKLAAATGARLHFSQLSCAESVALIAQAKQQGLTVSADVALQNLLFTDARVESFNATYHTSPPLREESDRQALLQGVREGTIDAITSAHRPHEAEAKLMPFGETEAGMSMVEHLLPLALALDETGELTLTAFIEAMTTRPAAVISETPAAIAAAAEANLVIFNPKTSVTYQPDTLLSHGKNSPLIGQTMRGEVIATILAGNFVFLRHDTQA